VAFARDSLELYTGLGEAAEGLRAVRARTEAWLAVTDGAEGVHWLDGETTRHLPAFPVEAVDTTGAGDVFHGALALALGEGQEAEEAVRFSSAAAALKCTHFGGRLGMPSRDELETFLGEHRSWS
jgi:sulfofructose kinase